MNWVTFDQHFNDAITQIPKITCSCVRTLSLCEHHIFQLFLNHQRFQPFSSISWILSFFFNLFNSSNSGLLCADHYYLHLQIAPLSSSLLHRVTLRTGWEIEVSKRHFDFQSRCVSFYVCCAKAAGSLRVFPTAACNHGAVQARMLRVIFHNHQNPTTALCPHQYLPLIRPPLPSLPLGRRHLYSAALCLATSAGAAILDRGAHHFNVNKSVSPWALLEWLPCAHQHPLRLGIMPYLGRAPAVYQGGGLLCHTRSLGFFFFFLKASS